MTKRKLLILMILTALLTLNAGCASTSKSFPVDKASDLVPLNKGVNFTAPVSGWFLSDSYYKFETDKCK